MGPTIAPIAGARACSCRACSARHERAFPAGRRRRELDLLRICACLIQFPFHTAKVFDHDPAYHIKNAVESGVLDLFAAFCHVWRMPLFFFIAGFAAVTALGSRSVLTFLKTRFLRLLPPLLVGLILFAPVIKYLERRSGIDLRPSGLVEQPGPFDLDFLSFYVRFFTRLNQFTWSHLWFIIYLLLFSLVFAFVLRHIARAYDRMRGGWAWIVVPALLCAAVEVALRPIFGDLPNLFGDWANIAGEVVFFLMGAIVAREPRIEQAIADRWKLLLATGLGAFALFYWGEATLPALARAGHGVAAWCLVAGLLGLGRYMGRQRTAFDRYMGEATLPLYVMHHLPVVALAFIIVPLDWNLWLKAAVICTGAAAITFATYHFVVRPFGPTRFLAGLRPSPPGRPGANTGAEVAARRN
ncbi:acyltransferase family protein [Oleomonas cavernae]|uniref:acyltransferase family protein n=1 Tax=Oleomonas cavernae TaxID=2320859 RepID=UPI001313F402|nr:acyltransferase family protein [Oleomonas cavernae]